MITLRNVLASSMLAATIFCGSGATLLATTSSASAQAYSYGGVRYTSNASAYTFRPQAGQSGNVTFFGGRPTTLPSHSGQAGSVTYLGGAKTYSYPGHSGQVGNVTYIGARPAGTVPVPQVRTPNVIRIR